MMEGFVDPAEVEVTDLKKSRGPLPQSRGQKGFHLLTANGRVLYKSS